MPGSKSAPLNSDELNIKMKPSVGNLLNSSTIPGSKSASLNPNEFNLKTEPSAQNVQEESTSPSDIGDLVLKSIARLKEKNGTSLRDIRKHLASEFNINVDSMNTDIKRFLRGAIKEGVLSLDNRKYKMTKKAAKRGRSRRRRGKSAAKSPKKKKRSRRSRGRSKGRSKRRSKSRGKKNEDPVEKAQSQKRRHDDVPESVSQRAKHK